MTSSEIDFPNVIKKFDKILERGLCSGLGSFEGQMCIEAAITQALDLPFNDEPKCVSDVVRKYKIVINDANWSSPQARAKGLRDIGIAQIGSKGIIDDFKFCELLTIRTVNIIIPALFEEIFGDTFRDITNNCRIAKTLDEAAKAAYYAAKAAKAAKAANAAKAAKAAYYAANAANAAKAAYYAADAAYYAAYYANYAATAADAAKAAYYAAETANADKYLLMSVDIALNILKELKSPGCKWI